jgi:recombination protein RecR
MKYPLHLLKLIEVLKKLPGVGNKSAERFAFEILNWPKETLDQMALIIGSTKTHLQYCQQCGCLIGIEDCPFCTTSRCSHRTMCIVAQARDVFAIEGTHEFRGLYHVLGSLLSPMNGIGPEKLKLHKLYNRIVEHKINEVVIALDSTLEGDATALFLKQELEPLKVSVSRLAFGLPMGSSLDYVDGGTLARAMAARSQF